MSGGEGGKGELGFEQGEGYGKRARDDEFE